MPEISFFIGILGILIILVGYGQYIYEIHWKKTAKPHLFTWMVWSIVLNIGAFAQFSEGERLGSVPLFVSGILSLYIASYAFWKKEIVFTLSDWVLLFLALSAIPLWIFTKTPLYSMMLATFIDISMYFPTLRKTWKEPWSEPLLVYVSSLLSFGFSLFLLEKYSFITLCYPVGLVIINVIFLILVFFRRKTFKAL